MNAPTSLTCNDLVTPLGRRPRHIPALDGVRGIAILMVMTFHLVGGTVSTNPAIRFFSLLVHGFGWSGVDLFFVLSGFLITGILLDSVEDPHYFRNFYARRTLRIFPLYYGILAISFGFLPFLISMDTPKLLWIRQHQLWLWFYGSGLYDGWTGKSNFTCDWLWLPHFWSLGVEEQFYLVWPAVVLLCARRKVLTQVCVGVAAVVLIARLVAFRFGVSEFSLYVASPFRFDSLVIGGLVAVLARRPAGMLALVAPAFGMLVASFAVIVSLTVFGGFANDHDGTARYFTPLALFFGSCLVLLAVANPAAGGVQGAVGRAIAHPLLRFFGRYSYGLYVLETLMQPLWNRVFRTDEIVRVVHSYLLAGFAHLVLCVGSTLALAMLSFHFYEKPFLGLKRYFEPARRSGGPVGMSAGGPLTDPIQRPTRRSDMPDMASQSDEAESLGFVGN